MVWPFRSFFVHRTDRYLPGSLLPVFVTPSARPSPSFYLLLALDFPALPHLTHTSLLLTPLLPLFTAYIISLLGFNVAKWALSIYFGVS